jgi:hypothetical protein
MLSNVNNLLIMRDYYNERANVRREELESRSPIHVLLNYLLNAHDSEFDAYYRIELGVAGSLLIYLYFSHKQHNELLIENSEIFIVDSIYKINRFKMFLVNIVGMTAINKSFYIKNAFI